MKNCYFIPFKWVPLSSVAIILAGFIYITLQLYFYVATYLLIVLKISIVALGFLVLFKGYKNKLVTVHFPSKTNRA